MNIKRFPQFRNKYYLLMGDNKHCRLLLREFIKEYKINGKAILEVIEEIRTGKFDIYKNIIGIYLNYDSDSARWFFYPFRNEEERVDAERDEDITYTFSGEFKYENGKFYIDPLKSDAKKYNL